MSASEAVWVFVGTGAAFPSGVFREEALARTWIQSRRLSGVLTQYPLDISVIDWAGSCGFVDLSQPKFSDPKVIQRFSSAHQKHVHFEDGRSDE